MNVYPGIDSSGCLRIFVYPLALFFFGLGLFFLVNQNGGFIVSLWVCFALFNLALWMVLSSEYSLRDHKLGDGSRISRFLVSTWWIGLALFGLLLFVVIPLESLSPN
jgi:hypothetical protein